MYIGNPLKLGKFIFSFSVQEIYTAINNTMFSNRVCQVRSSEKLSYSRAQCAPLEYSQVYVSPNGLSTIDIENAFAVRT